MNVAPLRPGGVYAAAGLIVVMSAGCGLAEPPPLPVPPEEVLVLPPRPLDVVVKHCVAQSDAATVVPADRGGGGRVPTVRGREGDRVRLAFEVRGVDGPDLATADEMADAIDCHAIVTVKGFFPPGTAKAAAAPLGVVIEDTQLVELEERDGVWHGEATVTLPEPTTLLESRQAATAYVWSGRRRSGLLELAHVEVARD